MVYLRKKEDGGSEGGLREEAKLGLDSGLIAHFFLSFQVVNSCVV